MIGKIIIGKSFRGCINYCLDKKEAELLFTNYCYGNKKELISQFDEVRRLNQNLSKPVQHVTISFAKEEQLDKGRLVSIAEDCAKDFGFDKNQYIVIAHHDTGHVHFHIVANRVGFDGKTVKDNHNYQRMAAYCRQMEIKHGLHKVLNPKRYLPKELRYLTRVDNRKAKLHQDIIKSIAASKNYFEFEEQMNKKGYHVHKARGIAFVDPQKVRVKGSEVGYSLTKIETMLSLQPEQKKIALHQNQFRDLKQHPVQQKTSIIFEKDIEKSMQLKEGTEILIKSTLQQETVDPGLLKRNKQKRKRVRI